MNDQLLPNALPLKKLDATHAKATHCANRDTAGANGVDAEDKRNDCDQEQDHKLGRTGTRRRYRSEELIDVTIIL
jgi:hypothetical protein